MHPLELYLQVGQLGESAIAYYANIGPGTAMRLYMLPQAGLCGKSLATDFAGIFVKVLVAAVHLHLVHRVEALKDLACYSTSIAGNRKDIFGSLLYSLSCIAST